MKKIVVTVEFVLEVPEEIAEDDVFTRIDRAEFRDTKSGQVVAPSFLTYETTDVRLGE